VRGNSNIVFKTVYLIKMIKMIFLWCRGYWVYAFYWSTWPIFLPRR